MAAAPQERPTTRTSSAYIAEMLQGAHSFKVSMKRGTGAVGVPVTSDTFAVGGHRWRILCYPRRTTERTKTYVAVLLDLASESDGVEVEVQVLYDFKLLDRATGVFSSVFSVKQLPRPSKGPWGNDLFIKRSLLAASYLKDGCIEIECDVTVVRQVLVVARSSVFKEILYGSTRIGNEVTSIKIEDVEPDAFKALLHFIYTDLLSDMDDLDGEKGEETVCRLLVAAEKYGIERMKSVCVDILRKRLDDKSVAGTLALADKHRCSEVRDACIEFMKRECPAVYIDILEEAARYDKI